MENRSVSKRDGLLRRQRLYHDLGSWSARAFRLLVVPRPDKKLALVQTLIVRIELPGYDFDECYHPMWATEEMALAVGDLGRIVHEIKRAAFEQSPIESVVKFIVNGASDDVRYEDARLLQREEFQKHIQAKMLTMAVAFDESEHVPLSEEKDTGGPKFLELETRIHEGMRYRV
ncbi:hypothetical protein LTR36_004398 [Oleoguttula mirabilis]|uniref:Uncharacterized protein n=1 Tax=Oleoguttula mirabilis TaxID=1507867 RepID=A0AAV9JFT9_9PEZI|nr:hypothetical protein LTR36_004398 [Oleoguttula mirabilis]